MPTLPRVWSPMVACLALVGVAATGAKADDDGSATVRTDRYGDTLPAGAVARLGTVRFHHHELIHCLALSPDGKTVATAGGHRVNHAPRQPIRIWDLATGREVGKLLGHTGPADCVAFSPDGKLLASVAGPSPLGRDDTVRVWDVATGRQLQVLRGHGSPHRGSDMEYAVAFSPDGKLLASSGQDLSVRLWDVATGKEVRRWFCKDWAAWEVATGNSLGVLHREEGGSAAVRLSPDGNEVIMGIRDGTVRWWDRRAGRESRQVKGTLLGSSVDGKLLVIGGGAVASVHEAASGGEVRRFPLPWTPALGRASSSRAALLAGGAALVACDGNALRVLDTRTEADLHPSRGHSGRVVFVGFSPDGKRLVTAGDTTVRLWDARTGEEVWALAGHRRPITSGAMTVDGGTVATGSWDGTVRLWDLAAGKESRRLDVDRDTSPLVCFSPDGGLLAAKFRYGGSTRNIHLWRAATGKELRRLGAGNWGHALLFLADGRALADLTSQLTLFDPDSGNELRTLQRMHNSRGDATGLAFSPDGRVAAMGYPDGPTAYDPRTVSLWEMASGSMIARLRGHEGPVGAVAFAGDGRLIASGSTDVSVRLWDVTCGRECACLRGHRGSVLALAFSRDGRALASGGSDGTALVWDVASLATVGRAAESQLTPAELQRLWTELLAEDPAPAYRALWKLVAAPRQTVPFLRAQRQQLCPDERRVQELIADLDDVRFEVRNRATHELKGLGSDVEPSLRRLLHGRPSQEVRRRVESVLAGLRTPQGRLPTQQFRSARAAQVLEYIGSPAAGQVLEGWAGGPAEAWLTQEARDSLNRLARRTGPSP
jgi:WD40 repeat protein